MKTRIKQGEMLCTTTVRIETEVSVGTGFFYSIGEGENYIPCVITNRHVAEGAHTIRIVVTKATEIGERVDEHYTYIIRDAQIGVIYHPTPDVDLCAITLFPIINDLKQDGVEVHTYFFTKGVIPNEEQLSELDAIEEVLMVGYPRGLWDEKNNMPLVRKGITATSAKLDFNGKKEFLVDMACFPGSSGSPVVYLDKQYKTELVGGIMGHKLYLLGVLYAGPQHFIEAANEKGDVIGGAEIPMNLGIVLKAQYILDLEKLIIKEAQA